MQKRSRGDEIFLLANSERENPCTSKKKNYMETQEETVPSGRLPESRGLALMPKGERAQIHLKPKKKKTSTLRETPSTLGCAHGQKKRQSPKIKKGVKNYWKGGVFN